MTSHSASYKLLIKPDYRAKTLPNPKSLASGNCLKCTGWVLEQDSGERHLAFSGNA